MSSKAQRKRAKRSRQITLAGGEAVPQRAAGRDRTHTNQPQEDARIVSLTARAKRAGLKDAAAAIDPTLSTDMGLCINKLHQGDTRAQIIDAWGAISASRRNYLLHYIGQSGEPKGATIAMVPDATETDPSLRVDIRSPDERADQAKASWTAWEAKINALPWPQMKWAIRGALDGFMGEASLWRDCAPTPLGTVAVEALRRMSATS
jgi:hypothetical protein